MHVNGVDKYELYLARATCYSNKTDKRACGLQSPLKLVRQKGDRGMSTGRRWLTLKATKSDQSHVFCERDRIFIFYLLFFFGLIS